MKVNPWSLSRPQRRVITRTFQDPALPEGLPLTLKEPDGAQLLAINDLAEELIERWLTGGDEGPAGFQAPDGQPVEISETLCRTVAALLRMQQSEAGEAGYTEIEWVGWSVMLEQAWPEICQFAGEVLSRAPTPGNSSGAAPATATGA